MGRSLDFGPFVARSPHRRRQANPHDDPISRLHADGSERPASCARRVFLGECARSSGGERQGSIEGWPFRGASSASYGRPPAHARPPAPTPAHARPDSRRPAARPPPLARLTRPPVAHRPAARRQRCARWLLAMRPPPARRRSIGRPAGRRRPPTIPNGHARQPHSCPPPASSSWPVLRPSLAEVGPRSGRVRCKRSPIWPKLGWPSPNRAGSGPEADDITGGLGRILPKSAPNQPNFGRPCAPRTTIPKKTTTPGVTSLCAQSS